MGTISNLSSISLSEGIAQLRDGGSRFRHKVAAQLGQNSRLG